MDRSLRRALLLLAASSPGAAYAAGWSVPGDGDTIAEVLAFAAPWDTISVDPWSYAGEPTVYVETPIVIESSDSSGLVEYPPFVVASGAALTLGGGVVYGYEYLRAPYEPFDIEGYAGILVVDGTFEGHSLLLYGGNGSAIFAVDSSVSVASSEFRDAFVSAALYALGYLDRVDVTVRESVFADNAAGAIFVQDLTSSYDSTVTIEFSEFNGNSTPSSGADLAVLQLREASIVGTSFSGSAAGGYGGAIAAYDTDLSVTEWSSFDGCSASGFGSIYAEGWTETPSVYIRDATFSGGYAWGSGDTGGSGGEIGGTYVDLDVAGVLATAGTATYGGFLKADGSTVSLADASIWYSSALVGGAVLVSNGSDAVIDGVDLCGNRAEYGAAVYAYASRLELTESFVHLNQASAGGAVEVDLGDVILRDDTFVANQGPYGAAGILSSTARVRNNIFTGSARSIWTDADTSFLFAGYNLYHALTELDSDYSTVGNVFEDPAFVASFSSDECGTFPYLSLGSPAIDMGDPSLVDSDGTRSDIGAFGPEDEPDDTGVEPDTGDSGVVIDTGDSGVVVDTADTGGLPDADGDGTPNGEDCGPGDPSVHPGAYDDPTDDVDQDCDGDAASGTARGGCGCDSPGAAPTFALVALGLALSRRRS